MSVAPATPEMPVEEPQPPSRGRQVASAAGIMMAAILLSRVLGLVRDSVVAYYFGGSANFVADCYKAAFALPDLLYYLIAGGALSSAFIPVFTEYYTRKQEEEAWRVFSIFGTALAIGLTGVVIVGMIFTEPLLKAFIVPGFSGEKLALTASLTRIVLPAQLCFFLGGLMMGTLHVRNQFLIPALGPVVYNVAIIVGGIIGGSYFGKVAGIYGLAWGVLVGAIIGNVFMQAWAMRRLGSHYRPSLNIRHPGVVRVGKLLLPVLLGLSITQLHAIIVRPFGSYLEQGSITWLDNANKVMQMPLGIFGQALGVALLPALSALVAAGDWSGVRRSFSLGFRSILFLTIPSSALIMVLALPITRVLFQRGEWTPLDTEMTSQATVYYAVAIFAHSGAQIVNRAFYAMQNTLTPMLVGTAATALYIAINFGLMHPMGHNGLALSMTITAILNLLALLYFYRRAVGALNGGEILSSVTRVTLASVVTGVAAWGVVQGINRLFHVTGPANLSTPVALLQIALVSAVGVVVYLAAVTALRVPEAAYVMDIVKRRVRRRRAQA